jgi:hypothetical protein
MMLVGRTGDRGRQHLGESDQVLRVISSLDGEVDEYSGIRICVCAW